MVYNNALPIYHVAFAEFDQKHFLTIYDLLDLIKKGIVTADTYVWKMEMKNGWMKADTVSELRPFFATPPCVPEEIREDNTLPD